MATSRTQASGANALATGLYQLVLVASSFLIPRVLIGNYGSEANGLVTSLTQFVSYFTVVEAGIAAAATFALYRPLSTRSWNDVSRVVSAARTFYIRVGFIFVALVLALAVIYPLFLTVSGLAGWQVSILVFSLGAAGFLDFFTLAKYRALLTADKKTWIVQFASSVFVVLNTLVIVVLGNLGINLIFVYIVAILPTFVRAAILLVYARTKYRNVDYKAATHGDELHQRWDAFFLQALSATQTAAPMIIATVMLPNLTSVSVFSIYMLVAIGCQRISNILGTGMQAIFGEILVKESLRVLQRAYREYELLIVSMTAVICGVAIALIIPFVTLYTRNITSDDYTYPALGLLTVASIFTYQIKAPHGLMAVAAGLFRETRWRTLAQALILLIASTVLSIWFGFYGIFVGIIISNLYRAFDLAIHMSREVTKLSPFRTLYRDLLALAQIAAISAPFILWEPAIGNWSTWLLYALALTAWGVVVVLLSNLAVSTADTKGLLRRVGRLFSSR